MTHQEKLEAVRKACVEANPGIMQIRSSGRPGIIDGRAVEREIRIADVLNALMYTEHVVCIASNERFEVFNKKKNEWEQVFKTWYLLNDDLAKQSEETVDFIHSLLAKPSM